MRSDIIDIGVLKGVALQGKLNVTSPFFGLRELTDAF